MHGPREEVCVCVCVCLWGGNRWPRLTLKITSSIGNKQLSSNATPGKCWTPFGTKNYIFSELMEYNEGMSNMLGVSI